LTFAGSNFLMQEIQFWIGRIWVSSVYPDMIAEAVAPHPQQCRCSTWEQRYNGTQHKQSAALHA
jgi:hypothetical protein